MRENFKITRKILSLVLATLMVFSVVQTTAFAKDTEAVTEAENITDTTAPLGGKGQNDEIIENLIPANVSDNTLAASGQCGDNVYWSFNSSTGALTISGTGKMYDYSSGPFYSDSLIKSVTIESGVTSIGGRAFEGCSGLTSITIPDSVTSIGGHAFERCTGLTSIEIPDSVTSIGYEAFWYCTGLTSVTIGNSVSSIGSYAFYNCSSLTSITISDSVTSIGEFAFVDCKSLTSITISDSVTSIGGGAFYSTGYYNDESNWENDVLYIRKYLIDAKNSISGHYSIKDGTVLIANNAFEGCTGLTSVTIPDSVTSIGSSAFSRCTGLTSIVIPDIVTNIGISAFKGCSGLTTVTISNSVTSIGNVAFSDCNNLETVYFNAKNCTYMGLSSHPVFYNCTKLSTVVIGEEVTNIPSYAFYNCTGLTSITIPDSVTSIGSSAFKGCNNLATVYFNAKNCTEMGSYPVFENCSKLLTVVIGEEVTNIPSYAFYGCTGLTSVTIPDSVTSIGEYTFDRCTGLTSVTIGNSVTSIGSGAFYYCTGLTSVMIPDSVTSIGSYAFSGCNNLATVYFNAKNCTKMGSSGSSSVFYNCSKLSTVVIGEEVTIIPSYAFYGCTGLTSIEIPDSVTSIGKDAFNGCTGLTSVTIGNSVTSIGDNAFSGCNNLATVYFNAKNCTYMGSSSLYSVFKNCSKLSTVVIGKEVANIPKYAFYGCAGLTSVTIPDSVTSIGGYSFAYCTGLTSVTIGNSVTSIGDFAFYYCSSLTSVTIGNGVTSIGNYAFSGCTGLTSVTIPDSVTSIGDYAFKGCTGLTSAMIPNSVTSIGSYAFYGVKNIIYHGEVTGAPWGAKVLNGYADDFLVFENEEKKNLLACSSNAQGEVVIPDSVTSIGKGAFLYCTGLTSITIPDSVTSVGYNAFYGTGYYNDESNWENDVLYIGNHLIEAKTSISGSYSIKNGTIRIANYAFDGCTGLTSIEITDSVTSIGDDAFRGCNNLETVYFNAKNCTKMGSSGSYSVFYNCTKLSTVVIGKDVANIPDYAFYNCTGLTSIEIPNSVTSISYYAFYGCTSLTSVTIGNSVTSIGYNAFSGCTGLTSVTIGNSVTSIGNYAFSGCTGLTSVTIGNGVTSIGDWAFKGCNNLATVYFNAKNCTKMGSSGSSSVFYNCTKLSTVVIGKDVAIIPNYAFFNCTGLTSVTIPNSVTSIGGFSFAYCTGLTSVTIGNGVTSIGDFAFYYCSSLPSVTIGNGVTSIGNHAFSGCTGLTSVTIGNGVTSIGNYAFYGCTGLTSVTIGNSVTSIDRSAFEDCINLKDVYYSGSQEQWKKIAIGSSNSDITNATIHFNCAGPYDDYDTEYDSYEDSEEIKEAVGTYTFISGTLNKYTMAVVLDSNESPWVSDVTINGTKYDTSGKKIFPYHIDGYEGKTVVAAMKNNKIEWVRPVSSYVYGAFIEIVEPESFWYSPDDKKYTSETTQTVKVKVSNLLTNDIDMPSSPGYAQSIFETSTFRGKLAEHLNSKGIGALNLKKIQLTANNSSIQIVNATQSKDVSIKFGDTYEYTFTIKAAANPALRADEGSITTKLNAKITLSNGTTKSADKSYFSIKNTIYKTPEKPWEPSKPETGEEPAPVDSNTAAKQAASILGKKAVTLQGDVSDSLNKLFTNDQLDAIANTLYTEVAMYKAPKATFEETLSTKLIEEVFKCKTNYLVFGEYDITCTFQVKTKWGPIQVQFKCSANDFSTFGYRFAFNGTVTYKIVSGAEKLPNGIQTEGFAGGLVGADMQSFCNAVWSVAQSELKSAYNTAWGNDFNKAVDLIFGKSVNKVLKQTKYGSASGLVWKSLITPATKININCPVDVFVYDAENNLVASIVNDEVKLTNEDVIATVENGTKQLKIFIEGYKIEYVATANSTMDITVERYGSSDGLIDTTEFVDVPLKIETTYLQNEEDAFSSDSNLYLLSSDGETILSDSYSAVFHDHVSDGIIYHTENATCVDEGKAWGYCAVCNEYYILNVTTTTDHTPGQAVKENEVAPTCTAKGSYDEVVYCTSCGEEISREKKNVEALGHDYDSVVTNPTCTEAGYTTHTCSRCKDSYTDSTVNATGHTEGEWQVTVPATLTSEGTKELYCAVCGTTMRTESIPKLTQQDLKVKSVSIGDMTLGYKSSAVITPKIDAVDGAKCDVTYSSSNPSAVSVDNSGRVTSNKTFGFTPGSAVITVTVTDSNGNIVKDTCTVTVNFSAIQWIIKIVLFGWIWY